MLPDPKVRCPATGFARSCRDILAECDCPKFVSVKFRNPQNGELVDKFGCADSFIPLLLIENSQMSRQTGAAVESFRNEVVKTNEETVRQRQEALAYVGDRLQLGMK
jgi:hypothetical protein